MKYSEKIFLFAMGYLKKPQDAEELVQEVFTKVWDKRFEIKEELSFKSYLFTIAYHAVVDFFRKWEKEEDCLKYFQETTPLIDNTTGEKIEYSDLERLTRESIEKLPKKSKLVYTLSREKGLSNKEIAEHLNVSIKTVEYHLTQSIKFIKNHLGNEFLPSLLFIYLFLM